MRLFPALAAMLLSFRAVAFADPVDIKLPSQPLSAALREFARQTGVQVAIQSELTDGKTSPSLNGKYEPADALAALLKGTGLTAYPVNQNTYGIREVPSTTTKNDKLHTTRYDPVNNRLRLAQTNSSDSPNSQAEGPNQEKYKKSPDSSKEESGSKTELQEVVVTGSNIRGVKNDTAPMLTLGRDYIDRSGYSNMMQLVQSLPMNFSGGESGASETAAFGDSPRKGQNLTRGTGFNLHGLGSVATLTLINGRRVAPAAQGQFVDVSTLPLAAIERVEVLTDGASAIYGADAVAGVVNVILRKDFNGAETSADLGTATRGGTSEQRLSQTVGKSWSGGNALVVADYSKRDPLDARDRDYIVAAGGAPPAAPTYLFPKRKTGSLVFNLTQSLPQHFDLTANLLYSHEQVYQSQTDSSATVVTNHPVTNQGSALLGLGYEPFGDWRFEVDGTVGRMETVTDFTAVNVPTNRTTFLITDYRDKFDMWEADFKADGSLFSLPAGKVRLATGGSYRKDKLHSDRERVIPVRRYQLRAKDQRDVRSAFSELFVPIVSKEQGFSWARRIDLSVAARYDDYSDFGSTINPKVGLVWSPIDNLDLRASYGTSFRAPSVAEKALVTRGVQISNTLVDAPGGGKVPIFYLIGSAALTAEKSKNLSVGMTVRPLVAPGSELSVNYFSIDYTGRISTPPFDSGMLFERAQFGSLISEIPSDAAAQAYLASRVAAGDLYLDLLGSGATGVRYVFDWRQQNAAETRIDGVDVNVRYIIDRGANTYDMNLNLTRINKIRTALFSGSTAFDQLNTYEQPLKTRVRSLFTWLRGGWNSTAAVNYANSYTNMSVTPHEPVKAWTTVDLNLSYDFGGSLHPRILDGYKIALSVTNVFDVNPPHATDPLYNMGYDVFNADAMGRYTTLHLTKRW